ncbi:MAG TPA: hypothetical protein VJ805_07810 [Nitrospiraceae bacterium]|nr:hypothetical protein [Nitrospiraceae bacterium]
MRSKYIAVSILSLVGAGMVGCAPTQLGENWGTAYQTARENQTLNPEAGETLDPVVGMEGTAAATAMKTYRESFEKPDAEFNRSVVTSGVQTK